MSGTMTNHKIGRKMTKKRTITPTILPHMIFRLRVQKPDFVAVNSSALGVDSTSLTLAAFVSDIVIRE